MNRVLVVVLILGTGSAVASLVHANESAEPPEPSEVATKAGPPDQLRLEVVISRYQGEKRISNAPYRFVVSADRSKRAEIKMGIEVPVSVGPKEREESQYRNVGTNIGCAAQKVAEGLYQIGLRVETSSVFARREGQPSGPLTAGRPLFNSFRINVDPLLRDGQSVEAVASTDPVTGDVVKISVSLEVATEGP